MKKYIIVCAPTRHIIILVLVKKQLILVNLFFKIYCFSLFRQIWILNCFLIIISDHINTFWDRYNDKIWILFIPTYLM